MTWSPEELVKQLRLPDRIHIGGLMRDAADMIERLNAELANCMEARDAAITTCDRLRAALEGNQT